MKKIMITILVALFVFGSTEATAYASDNDQKEARIISVGYITASNVNLRVSPGVSSPSMGQLGIGDTLEDCMVDEVGVGDYVWIKVKITSGVHAGKIGWVASNYIRWTGSY